MAKREMFRLLFEFKMVGFLDLHLPLLALHLRVGESLLSEPEKRVFLRLSVQVGFPKLRPIAQIMGKGQEFLLLGCPEGCGASRVTGPLLVSRHLLVPEVKQVIIVSLCSCEYKRLLRHKVEGLFQTRCRLGSFQVPHRADWDGLGVDDGRERLRLQNLSSEND